MQFQTLARENIERIQAVKADKMISPCPHCLHTIGREYPTLDESFQPKVVHHSEFIEQLLERGAIQLDKGAHKGVSTTYHDPCYLGRYEGVTEAPRHVIRQTGLEIREMARHGKKATCCGGGSAGAWSQTEAETRVDQVRKQHVKDTGADLLVVGCPECKMMLDAATKETKDLAELVAESLIGGREAAASGGEANV